MLSERGYLGDFEIHVWGRRIGLSTTAARTETGRALLDRIGRFRSWAERNGRSLEPFFDTCECSSSITGEAYTSLVVPTMLLVEYEDDEVRHVAPHRVVDDEDVTGDGTEVSADCSIEDRLSTLAEVGDGTTEGRPVNGTTGAEPTVAE
jgi:hypothetical protein